MSDWNWEECLIDLAHEVGTYRVVLEDSRSLPLLVEKLAKEFRFANSDAWEAGWPDGDYIDKIESHVREALDDLGLIPSTHPTRNATAWQVRDRVLRIIRTALYDKDFDNDPDHAMEYLLGEVAVMDLAADEDNG